MDEVMKYCQEKFPNLPELTSDKCIEKFLQLGVESVEDLKDIEAGDLKDILKPIPIRRFLGKIKELLGDWASDYKLPGHFPSCVQKALKENRPCNSTELKMLVHFVADDTLKYCKKPTKPDLEHVVKKLVGVYPETFLVKLGENIFGTGYNTLLNKFVNRIDFLTRAKSGLPNSMVELPKADTEFDSSLGQPRKKLKKDSYGCVNWGPKDFKSGETIDTVKEKKSRLQELYQDPEFTIEEVKLLMTRTFESQRMFINSLPSMAEEFSVKSLLREWPFLNHSSIIFQHFQELTEIDILAKLTCNKSQMNKVIDFIGEAEIKKKSNPLVLKLYRKGRDSNSCLCMVQMLCSYFGEQATSILKFHEAGSVLGDIKEEAIKTPGLYLSVVGDIFDFAVEPVSYLVVNRHIFGGPYHLKESVPVLFCVIYMLNWCYPEGCASTLEFYQRCIVELQPPKGGKGKKSGINPKVSSLVDKLRNREWQIYSSED